MPSHWNFFNHACARYSQEVNSDESLAARSAFQGVQQIKVVCTGVFLAVTSATKVTLLLLRSSLKLLKKSSGKTTGPYGAGANNKTLEAFLHHHQAQGMSQHKLRIEELLDPSTYKSYSIWMLVKNDKVSLSLGHVTNGMGDGIFFFG